MSHSLDQLIKAAGESARAGRWEEAERLWGEVHKLEPRHPQALYSLGVHAMRRGQLGDAYDLLKAARQASPRNLLILMALAVVSQKRGDAKSEREAIEAALAVDAYYLPAILAKAAWIERHGVPAAAVDTYRAALTVASPEAHWPAELRSQLEHARGVVVRYSEALNAYLNDALSARFAALPRDVAARWREAASIIAGRSKPYNVDCNQLHVPRLPAVPFFDRAEFPWVKALEAKTDVIRDELAAVLETDKDRFVPYVARRPGEPVNQWKDLNHSTRWGAFHLWANGKRVEENLARCPETAKALAEVPMAEIEGLCPNVMFSALAPKTHIPPHHGETNARIVAHLPLIVPDGCSYRVGFEQRQWQVGEVLLFDDTIEHEARNDSDELRVVLIFDTWNPLLSPAEREMVNAINAAAKSFAVPAPTP